MRRFVTRGGGRSAVDDDESTQSSEDDGEQFALLPSEIEELDTDDVGEEGVCIPYGLENISAGPKVIRWNYLLRR